MSLIYIAEESESYDFTEMAAFAEQRGRDFDEQVIAAMIPGCVKVARADSQEDRKGTDYFALLDSGRRLRVDTKARQRGCSKYWKNGPDLALETWSVMPDSTHEGKIGWSLDRSKNSDLILFTFDRSDCAMCILEPFQHLRIAFERRRADWYQIYPHKTQETRASSQRRGWRSECVFVPLVIVQEAIKEVSIGWLL